MKFLCLNFAKIVTSYKGHKTKVIIFQAFKAFVLLAQILHSLIAMSSSEERIRKLRQEVQSLRSLLERTKAKRLKNKGAPVPSKPKHPPKIKKDDDIPSF